MKITDLSPAERIVQNRRNFIKTFTVGSVALTTGLSRPRLLTAAPVPTFRERSRVAITSGTDRRKMVQEVMEPFRDVIRQGIRGKRIIIKPNIVETVYPLCAPHVDGCRGVLDFLKTITDDQITIGESSASNAGTFDGFKNYDYMPLEKEYGVKFMDMNLEPPVDFMIIDNDLHPLKIQVCGPYLDPNNYIISLCRLKTHNVALVTLGAKNIAMSAPYKRVAANSPNPVNWKQRMHGRGPHWLNYNMYQILRSIQPQFSVIESVVGLQGNGPHRDGFEMEHGVALAGDDFIAVDSIGAQLMGVAKEDVALINYCETTGIGIADRSRIDIVGGRDPQRYVKKYQLHDRAAWMLTWKDELPIQSTTSQGR
ncbi:DUF362 domain-containing protein [Candidatus Latescibacterota bacterium]